MKTSMSLLVLPSPRAAEPKIEACVGAISHSAISARSRRSSSERMSASSSSAGAARCSRFRVSGVALGRVEVLVPQQLLDLAQVGPGPEELGGEDVAECVRGDALALVDTGCLDVVAEGLAELGEVEPVALHTDEHRLLRERDAGRVVLGEERREGGVDRDRPLPPALRPPNSQQSASEVDVVPVESDQLTPAEAAIGHQGEQEPIALRLAWEVALPEVVACRLCE
jgi:hypothetical protein